MTTPFLPYGLPKAIWEPADGNPAYLLPVRWVDPDVLPSWTEVDGRAHVTQSHIEVGLPGGGQTQFLVPLWSVVGDDLDQRFILRPVDQNDPTADSTALIGRGRESFPGGLHAFDLWLDSALTVAVWKRSKGANVKWPPLTPPSGRLTIQEQPEPSFTRTPHPEGALVEEEGLHRVGQGEVALQVASAKIVAMGPGSVMADAGQPNREQRRARAKANRSQDKARKPRRRT